MWWTSAHQAILDQLSPDNKQSMKAEESIIVGTRRLQHLLNIADTRLALHLFRGIKEDVTVSATQIAFEEEIRQMDYDALNGR